MKLFLCEKPSQAKDVAKELGSSRLIQSEAGGYWETAGGIVISGFGHLLEQDGPEEYNPNWGWKGLKIHMLPMIPPTFTLHVRKGAGARLKEIGVLLKSCSCAVVATDGGREGEVIGREILTYHSYRGPIERLWLGALDPESIREALAHIRRGEETVNLYYAGLARGQADWLIGMNATSAVTLSSARGSGVYSVGRVQTPTLALVVRRDREISQFRAVDYYEFLATVGAGEIEVPLRHAPKDRVLDRAAADALAASLVGALGPIASTSEDASTSPPLPYDLSTLSAEADKKLGLSASDTLKIAQALYEQHKATTYPRSDCQYLPESQIGEIPKLWGNAVELEEFKHLKELVPQPRKTIFNTAKVGEHNGIVPTGIRPDLGRMSPDERAVYLMIVARYLAGLLPDYCYKQLELAMTISGRRFVVRGTQPVSEGWKAALRITGPEVEDSEAADGDDEGTVGPLPAISDGAVGRVEEVRVIKCATKKPTAYTEGALLKDMKAIAKFVMDPKKKARLKETSGIGTVATRPPVLENLKDNGYLAKKGRKLTATIKGHALIDRLEVEIPALVDPGETAVWEDALDEVAQGKRRADDFLAGIVAQVREFTGAIVCAAPPPAPETEVAPGISLADEGEFWMTPGVKGRLYKTFFGHTLTPAEVGALLGGGTITVTDCKREGGAPMGTRTVRFNPKKVPYPGFEFADGAAPIVKKKLL